jgi:hypothetical protein
MELKPKGAQLLKVKVTLQPTVRLGVEPHLGLMTRY